MIKDQVLCSPTPHDTYCRARLPMRVQGRWLSVCTGWLITTPSRGRPLPVPPLDFWRSAARLTQIVTELYPPAAAAEPAHPSYTIHRRLTMYEDPPPCCKPDGACRGWPCPRPSLTSGVITYCGWDWFGNRKRVCESPELDESSYVPYVVMYNEPESWSLIIALADGFMCKIVYVIRPCSFVPLAENQ